LYISSVVRPGDEINRNLPKGQTFQQGGVPSSTTSPTRLYNTDDFYTHGPTIRLVASLPGGAADSSVQHPSIRPAPPAVDWTGWYVGGNAGGRWTKFEGDFVGSAVQGFTRSGEPDVFSFETINRGSFLGGGQLGYNLQRASWVFGIEADFDTTDARHVVVGPGSFVFMTNNRFELEDDWQATLRARLGYAFDRWLAYLTGGVAMARVTATGLYGPGRFLGDGTPQALQVTPSAGGSDEDVVIGGVVGVGLEYAFTNAMSLGLEYRYTQFEDGEFDLGAIPFPGGLASSVTSSLQETESEITARLNFKLGGKAYRQNHL
jgi:outer membrane immunogenic protein